MQDLPKQTHSVQPSQAQFKDQNAQSLGLKNNTLTAQYEVLERLGKGSQGEVWLGIRKSDGQKVAIKQLNVHSVKSWKAYELFRREAEILASLSIEGVVPFYDYIEDLEGDKPCVCIVQKFIEGDTLAKYLAQKHRFATETIYDLVAQVLGILQKLHTHQPPVIHRDIKPSNLMLTPKKDGKFDVTLLDFGAVANPQVQNGGSTVAGTYGYMPPEQLMGQAQPASDIYALAAVAVQLLSGTSPADIEVCDFKLVIEPYLTHVKPEVVQTLHQMLEPAVSNRLCDHNILRAQFWALANQKSPSILDIFRKEKKYKLEDVVSIGQPGNYEIWQIFSYEKDYKIVKTLLEDTASDKIEKTSNIITALGRFLSVGILSVGKYIILVVITVLVFLIYIFVLGFMLEKMRLEFFITVWVLICLFGGTVAVGLIKTYLEKIELKVKSKVILDKFNALFYECDVNKMGESAYQTSLSQGGIKSRNRLKDSEVIELLDLMKSEKKIIAKIVEIQYVKINPSESASTYSNGELMVFTREKPKFRVKYQYRFPNGILESDKISCNQRSKVYDYDFYGEMMLSTSPEHYYKVGDMIPLLFSMDTYKNKVFFGTDTHNDDVFTFKIMPYPYPFEQLENINDIVYQFMMTKEILEAKSQDEIKSAVEHYSDLSYLKKEELLKIYDLCIEWGIEGAYMLKAKALDRLGMPQNALTMYKEEANKGNIDASLIAGHRCAASGSYLEALPYYEAAFSEDNPDFCFEIMDICKRAKCAQTRMKWGERASQYYRNASHEDDIPKYYKLFDLYKDNKVLDEIEFWGKKIYQAGDNKVCQMMADCFNDNGSYEKALEWYLKAPENSDVCIIIADLYDSQFHDSANAMIWYNKVLTYMDRNDPDYDAVSEFISSYVKEHSHDSHTES